MADELLEAGTVTVVFDANLSRLEAKVTKYKELLESIQAPDVKFKAPTQEEINKAVGAVTVTPTVKITKDSIRQAVKEATTQAEGDVVQASIGIKVSQSSLVNVSAQIREYLKSQTFSVNVNGNIKYSGDITQGVAKAQRAAQQEAQVTAVVPAAYYALGAGRQYAALPSGGYAMPSGIPPEPQIPVYRRNETFFQRDSAMQALPMGYNGISPGAIVPWQDRTLATIPRNGMVNEAAHSYGGPESFMGATIGNPQLVFSDAASRFSNTLTDGFIKPFQNFTNEVTQNWQNAIKNLQVQARRQYFAGMTLTRTFTLPVAAAGVGLIADGAQFQSKMAKVGALTDISPNEVPALSKAILDMSTTMPTSAKDLSDALYVIASAGNNASDSLKILESAGKASGAGMGTTGVIASALTSALSVYGDSASEAGKYTDYLNTAVREGKGAADEYAPALGKVVASAKSAGVGIKEVLANIALMTRSGATAEQAATALDRLFSNLRNVNSKGPSDTLKAIGLTPDKVTNTLHSQGLLAAQKMIMDASGGNDQVVARIIPSITGLRDELTTAGTQAKAYVQIMHDMDNAIGNNDKSFRTMQQTFSAQWAQMLNVAQRVFITISETLLPNATSAVKNFGGQVQETAGKIAFGWNSLGDNTKLAAEWAAGIAVAIGPLMTALAVLKDAQAALMMIGVGIAEIAPSALLLGAAWEGLHGHIGAATLAMAAFVAVSSIATGPSILGMFSGMGGTVAKVVGELKALKTAAADAMMAGRAASFLSGGGNAKQLGSAGWSAATTSWQSRMVAEAPGVASPATYAASGSLGTLAATGPLAAAAAIAIGAAAISWEDYQARAEDADVANKNLSTSLENINKQLDDIKSFAVIPVNGGVDAGPIVEQMKKQLEASSGDAGKLKLTYGHISKVIQDIQGGFIKLNLGPAAAALSVEKLNNLLIQTQNSIDAINQATKDNKTGIWKDFLDSRTTSFTSSDSYLDMGHALIDAENAKNAAKSKALMPPVILGPTSFMESIRTRRSAFKDYMSSNPSLLDMKKLDDVIAKQIHSHTANNMEEVFGSSLEDAIAKPPSNIKNGGKSITDINNEAAAKKAAQYEESKAIQDQKSALSSYTSALEGVTGKIQAFKDVTEAARLRNEMLKSSVDGIDESWKRQVITLGVLYDKMTDITNLRDLFRSSIDSYQSSLVKGGVTIDPNQGAVTALQNAFGYTDRMNSMSSKASDISQSARDAASALGESLDKQKESIHMAKAGISGISGAPPRAYVSGNPADASSGITPMAISDLVTKHATAHSASIVASIMAGKASYDGSMGFMQNIHPWERKAWGEMADSATPNSANVLDFQSKLFSRDGLKKLNQAAIEFGQSYVETLITNARTALQSGDMALRDLDSYNAAKAEARKSNRDRYVEQRPGDIYAGVDADLRLGNIGKSAAAVQRSNINAGVSSDLIANRQSMASAAANSMRIAMARSAAMNAQTPNNYDQNAIDLAGQLKQGDVDFWTTKGGLGYNAKQTGNRADLAEANRQSEKRHQDQTIEFYRAAQQAALAASNQQATALSQDTAMQYKHIELLKQSGLGEAQVNEQLAMRQTYLERLKVYQDAKDPMADQKALIDSYGTLTNAIAKTTEAREAQAKADAQAADISIRSSQMLSYLAGGDKSSADYYRLQNSVSVQGQADARFNADNLFDKAGYIDQQNRVFDEASKQQSVQALADMADSASQNMKSLGDNTGLVAQMLQLVNSATGAFASKSGLSGALGTTVSNYGQSTLFGLKQDQLLGRTTNETQKARINADAAYKAFFAASNGIPGGAEAADALKRIQDQIVQQTKSNESSSAGFGMIQSGTDTLRNLQMQAELDAAHGEKQKQAIKDKYDLIALQDKGITLSMADYEAQKAISDQIGKQLADQKKIEDKKRMVAEFDKNLNSVLRTGNFKAVRQNIVDMGFDNATKAISNILFPNKKPGVQALPGAYAGTTNTGPGGLNLGNKMADSASLLGAFGFHMPPIMHSVIGMLGNHAPASVSSPTAGTLAQASTVNFNGTIGQVNQTAGSVILNTSYVQMNNGNLMGGAVSPGSAGSAPSGLQQLGNFLGLFGGGSGVLANSASPIGGTVAV